MVKENACQKAVDLTNRIFQVSSGLDLPKGDHWPTLVIISLSQANERLDSIRFLLDKDRLDSSVILTRSLFELAVNVEYIAKDTSVRLSKYLKHGGIPTTREEAAKLLNELESGNQLEGKQIIPKKVWKSIGEMCSDLGNGRFEEYETFYRYASLPTHASASILGISYVRLLSRQSPSDNEKAAVLLTVSAFLLRVTEIAAKAFPKEIDLDEVQKLHNECRELVCYLARSQTVKNEFMSILSDLDAKN